MPPPAASQGWRANVEFAHDRQIPYFSRGSVGTRQQFSLEALGAVGQPTALIDGRIKSGANDLTVVANNAGVGRQGLARLLELRRVRKVICSFPRSSDPVVFEELYNAGLLELEIVPQGTLAKRMRAAGAGIPAFFTPTAVGTALAEGKEVRNIGGRDHIFEYALKADIALVEAWQADRWET